MYKASPSHRLCELKTSKKSDSDFNEENMALTKNKESNLIVKFKLNSKTNIKPSRNFLPKPFIESEKDMNKDFPYESHINYIFLYYEKTIEHLKKYKKIYNNYNNIPKIENNFNNIKDKYINEKKNTFLTNINKNTNTNINSNLKSDINNYKYVNYFLLNNSGKFYSNYGMDTIYENKIRESKIKLVDDNIKKLNANINEEKSKDNLTENENKNLIINIDYPPFKPSVLNNQKEDIKKENNNSNIIAKSSSNTIFETNTNDNVSNEDDDYLIEMFGKRGWICLLCNNFNYETRIKCNRCGELKKPKKITNLKLKMKKNQKEQKDNNNKSDNQNKNWICSYCKNFNYFFRNICNRCKIEKTTQIVYNYNPNINNYINYSIYPAQPFLLFNNFQNIYINNIANFIYK